MTQRFAAAICALMLGTCATPYALRAQTPSDVDVNRLIAAPYIDLAEIGRLYDRTIGRDPLAALHDRLDATARSAASLRMRATARLIEAGLHWRAGEEAAAMAAADSAVALAPGFDAWLMKAQLTDIADPVAAAEWYRLAQAAAPDVAQRQRIARRLAIADAMANPDALLPQADLGGSLGTRRVADALAMLGRPAAALRLAGAMPARDVAGHLRLAGWASAAGDTAAVRTEAWQAYVSARDPGDRRYALALLVEGYRIANDLRGAEAFLAAKPQTNDVTAVRIDVLFESGRLPEAIALARGSRDPEVRRRLIGILDLAGDAVGSEAEYRRLIAASPATVENYVGLASIHLGNGDEAKAQGVFRQLFEANRANPDVLADTARRMIDMGLTDAALSLMGNGAGTVSASSAGNRLFLFRTYLNRGEEAKARAELETLVASRPSDAVLGEVVDGYLSLQDPAQALSLLRRMEASGRPLDHDRMVQLATLAARTGATSEALDRWIAVWRNASLPARRSYAEQQIVRLARTTDRLNALTDESAARLRAGKLRPGEFDLLLTLRLAGNDRQGALADTRMFSAEGTVAQLQQAARSYSRLNDHAALQATLRRLAEIDPANRDDYLRQVILTVVRYGEGTPEARRRQLEQLTGQLTDRSSATALGFRGSILSMAGLGEDAITQYRLALAAAPTDGDALLRLADALKKQKRDSEALTLLQFAAETAATDDALATALDGMLDLVGDGRTAFLTLETSRIDVLRWVERRALGSLIDRGDGTRLEGIIADAASALGELDLQFRVYEAGLPEAAGQRPMLLRRLIALSSQPTTADGASPQVDDPKRKLLYARRLLTLRKAFPPDFYADIATTMLRNGDRAGAEGAFAMMSDATALVNVDEVRGRAFAAAGMTDVALANLGRALIRDGGNFDLLVDTSILRETRGETSLAFRWYWRGLDLLIARQPAGVADDRGDQGFDIGKFGPTMIEGAMLTWPNDPAGREAALAGLRRLSDDAVATVDPTAPGTLAGHGRLSAALNLSRRVRAAGHDDGGAAVPRDRLDRMFADDVEYRRAAAYFDALQGDAEPVAEGQVAWIIPGLVRQAVLSDNTALAVALAIRTDDMATIRSVLTDTLALDAVWNAAVAANSRAAGRPPQTTALLSQLIQGLPAERVRSAVVPLIDAAPQRETLLFDLYRQSWNDYGELSAAIGAAPIADERLIELMVTRGNDTLSGSARVGAAWGEPWPLDRFGVPQQLVLLDRLVTRIELGAPAPPLTISVIRSLLARTLDADQQTRLKTMLLRDVAFIRDPARRSVAPVLAHLLHPLAPGDKQALLLETAEAAARLYPDAAHFPAFLRAAFAKDAAEAKRQLDALEGGLASAYQGRNPIDSARAALAPPTSDGATTRPMESARSAPPEIGSAATDLLQKLLTAQRTAPASVPAILRGAWRTTPIDLWQRRSLVSGLMLATSMGPDVAAWERLLARPEVTAEFEAYLPAMDAETRHASQGLYDLIAHGLVAGGGARSRLDALLGALVTSRIDANGTQMLVALAAATDAMLDPAQTAALAERLRRMPAMAVDERLRAAAVLVQSGAPALAVDMVTAALDQTMYPLTPLDNAVDGTAIVAALARWSDQEVARRTYGALTVRADRFRATPVGSTYAALPPFPPSKE